eukprot:8673227-Alexandrium_andersonii.AAC.1
MQQHFAEVSRHTLAGIDASQTQAPACRALHRPAMLSVAWHLQPRVARRSLRRVPRPPRRGGVRAGPFCNLRFQG